MVVLLFVLVVCSLAILVVTRAPESKPQRRSRWWVGDLADAWAYNATSAEHHHIVECTAVSTFDVDHEPIVQHDSGHDAGDCSLDVGDFGDTNDSCDSSDSSDSSDSCDSCDSSDSSDSCDYSSDFSDSCDFSDSTSD
jgi:hypothetical protein